MTSIEEIWSGIEGGAVRVCQKTMKASVIDVVQLVTQKTRNYSSEIIRNVLNENPDIREKITNFKFPGARQRMTPVADAATLVEIIFLLPGIIAQQFRRRCAVHICRLLGGDESLIGEIRSQSALVNHTPLQQFLLQPTKEVDLLEWQQKRTLARDGTKAKAEIIRATLPDATCSEYAKNNGLINKSIMGISKNDLKKTLCLTKPFVARNYMTTSQLALVRPAEDASAGIYRVDHLNPTIRNQHLTDVYSMISRLSDFSGLKRKCLSGPLHLASAKRSRIMSSNCEKGREPVVGVATAAGARPFSVSTNQSLTVFSHKQAALF